MTNTPDTKCRLITANILFKNDIGFSN